MSDTESDDDYDASDVSVGPADIIGGYWNRKNNDPSRNLLYSDLDKMGNTLNRAYRFTLGARTELKTRGFQDGKVGRKALIHKSNDAHLDDLRSSKLALKLWVYRDTHTGPFITPALQKFSWFKERYNQLKRVFNVREVTAARWRASGAPLIDLKEQWPTKERIAEEIARISARIRWLEQNPPAIPRKFDPVTRRM